jgi:hypothetical protein
MVSRTKWRGWVVALEAGLLSSLVLGCRLPLKRTDTPLQQAEVVKPAGQDKLGDVETKPNNASVPPPPVPVATQSGNNSSLTRVAGVRVPGKPPESPPPSVPVATQANTKPDDPDLEPKRATPVIKISQVTVGPPPNPGSEESETHKMPEPPLLAALRCYLEKKPREAIGHLSKFDQVNQELLICLLPLAVQLADSEKPSDQQSAMAVEQLESVMYGMRTRAPLRVEKMCLCKSISAFGVYEPMPQEHVFQPGEQLRVYAELRNFSSERHDETGGPAVFVTQLSSTAEIRDHASKKTVWKQPLQRGEPDRSQTPRHDYFDHYRFCLPDLHPGWYTLEVTVEDLATHRKSRRAVDLKVGLLPQGS